MPDQGSLSAKSPERTGATLLRVLIAVLALEMLATAGAVVLLTVEQFVDVPSSRTVSIALLALVVIALAFIVALLLGAIRRAPWVRGAAVTWQILQLAAAWTILQGDMATLIGWGLTVLSVVGIVCAVHPATRLALRPREG